MTAKEKSDQYVEIGLMKKKLNDYPGALKEFSLAIEIDKESYRALFERIEIQEELGNLLAAIHDYDTLITMGSPRSDLHSKRGLLRSKNNDLKGAVDDFTCAINLTEGYVKADSGNVIADFVITELVDNYSLRAEFKFKLGDVKGAYDDYNAAYKYNPDYMMGLNYRDEWYFKFHPFGT